MSSNIYKLVEIVGSSPTSTDDAIRNALKRASSTIKRIGWFEVLQTRGHVENGEIAHFQVLLKIGFTLDDDIAD